MRTPQRSIREGRRLVGFDVIARVHRVIASTTGALWIRLRGCRRGLRKSLDNLDREIRKGHLAGSVDSSRAGEDRLDVDALRSTEELRLLIDLYLRGWTAQEIKEKLDRTTSGSPFDS